MAPRTVKAKKAADVKAAENEAPKKGRGKAKNISEAELKDEDKMEVVVKKTKRGKKDNEDKANGEIKENAPPAKKGRGKKNISPIDEDLTPSNDNLAEESGTPAEEINSINNDVDNNGHADEVEPPKAKGRKKAVKKDVVATKPKESDLAKENAKEENNDAEQIKKEPEEKPKGRGRGRKVQPKVEEEAKSEDGNEPKPEKVAKPAPKGRKKAPTKAEKAAMEAEKAAMEAEKAAKEMETADNDQDSATSEVPAELENTDKNEEKEKESKEDSEPKKGRKGGKKASAKDETNEENKEEKENGKGDVKDDKEMEVDTEVKPTKTKRGQKKVAEKSVESEDGVPDTGEPTTKRRRKAADDKAEDSKKKVVNKSATDYESIDFSNSSKNTQGKEWNFKISCWNVDGIRAWLGKGGLDYIKYEKPDILCLQEIKCARDKLPDEVANIPGYHAYWLSGDIEGYAGVGIYTTKLAMNVQYGLKNEEFDDEGRIITAEYEQFYLICTYVPNAGRKLVTLPKRLKWNEEFRKHVRALDEKKPVIICGDMNVSHNEIDLTNPKTNKKNAGFTEEERAGMTQLLGDGFVDTFRHLNPDKTGAYTFWSYMFNSRAKNVGWRLDYFIISERLLPFLCDSVIRDKVYGSDHCPISLFLHLSTADKPKE